VHRLNKLRGPAPQEPAGGPTR